MNFAKFLEHLFLQNTSSGCFCKPLKSRLPFRKIALFYMNIVHTNKLNKKLQSSGALNIQETPGDKQKEIVKNNVNK